MATRQILVVDDEIGIRELLNDILLDEGYQVKLAENAAEARKYRQQYRPDLVLLDIWMPDCDGVTLLKEWSSSGLLTMPVVMMSGHGTIDTAVEATRIGAFDFLEKPIALQKLLKTVTAALKSIEQSSNLNLNLSKLGKSAAINELKLQLERMANLKAPLLLMGPAGTGLELCARFLHQSNTPWLTLNVLNRLADEPTEILSEVAEGTLFIAEVADLTRSQQKGLYALISQAEKYHVQVVCATAALLGKLANEQKFDANLAQILGAASIVVPALNDHKEDIPDIACAIANVLVESREVAYKEFDTAALNALRNANWPGNLAQLEAVVKSLMQNCQTDTIGLEAVKVALTSIEAVEVETEIVDSFLDFNQPLREAREDFERRYFQHYIGLTQGNIVVIAEKAGLERTHLYRKLKQLGIKLKG